MIDDRLLLEGAALAGELNKMALALALVAAFGLTIMALQWAGDRFGPARVARWLWLSVLALAACALALQGAGII